MSRQETKQQNKEAQPKQVQRIAGTKLSLEIGTRMIVSLNDLHGADERIVADLVGMVHFEYLILRMPWVPGIRTRLVDGISATVRLVSQGELCGFQSPILTHVANPSLLLFLEYPETIEKLVLRRDKRVQCVLPALLNSRHGDANGIIVDLSRSGCRIAVDTQDCTEFRQTVLEDTLTLRAPLNPDGAPVSVTCTVRNVSSDANRMQLGLSFTDAGKDFWDALDAFLATVP
ncbi:MAG: flagellar brake protein [Syntrophorhabdaceae bacterium]|nr:flagellar brake protein [Syntrophorhabdaceae bacterium]